MEFEFVENVLDIDIILFIFVVIMAVVDDEDVMVLVLEAEPVCSKSADLARSSKLSLLASIFAVLLRGWRCWWRLYSF